MNISLKPIITEKALIDQEKSRYRFDVNPKATKKQIETAFKAIFSLNPIKINVLNRQGKIKTDWRRRQKITKNNRKIAIITLPAGQKIESLVFKKK